MTHDSCREKLLDLAYGELAPRDARAVERHLEACDACRTELARIRETRAAMSALGPVPAPEPGERILLAAARAAAEEARRRRPAPLLPSWMWAGAVGTVAILAVAAVSYRLVAMRPGRRDDPNALLARSPAKPEAAPVAEAPAGPPAAEPEPAAPREAPGPATPRPVPSRPPASPERFAAAPAQRAAPFPPAAGSGSAEREDEVAGASAPEPPAREAAGSAAGYAAAPPSPAPALSDAGAAPRKAPERKTAASRAALPEPAEDAMARFERLDRAGALRRSVVRREGCPGEQVREIDRDPSGRVVRLAVLTGSGWVEQVYGPDGALAAVRVGGGPAVRFDPPGRPPAGATLPAGIVHRAEDVRDDAPPRCE
jgi:hypothetical protein